MIGVITALFLIVLFLFGSREAINPDAMIPYSWREGAFISLATGSIFMVPVCFFVYRVSDIKSGAKRKFKTAIIFLPGIICSICAFFIIGVILYGMLNMLLNRFN